ncbi:MAG: L-aspartate oxidase [Streptococcaceae bacterium]|jgi:L-aspartate oxidase|nr:L-aspartate oxidase [Streptococcaceae bacterium]
MKKKVVIVGGGLAGSFLAMLLQKDCKVTLLTKTQVQESNSMLAQGGIAAVMSKSDSFVSHIHDTLVAGNFHNDARLVKIVVEEGPKILQELMNLGLFFDKDENGNILYGMEGAHSKKRILHSKGDQTGRIITSFVQSLWQDVNIIENAYATEIIKNKKNGLGLLYLDEKENWQEIFADKIILATGGIGGLFSYTSNDKALTGDGIALAMRAKAEVKDLEFIQFHPTLLLINGHCCGLISEAVRGDGARLINDLGEYFMKKVHHFGDLATRDIVSRKVYQQILNGRKVFLDLASISNFAKRFPTIDQNLKRYGFKIKEDCLIPIQPGEHFLMGGIKTDLFGATSIPNLYAVGEVACSGVHGANRLAGNSLLEILVFAKRVAADIKSKIFDSQAKFEKRAKEIKITPNLPTIQNLQKRAWNAIGIVRKTSEMEDFLIWLEQFNIVEKIPKNWSKKEIECYNLCQIARNITKMALARKKSLGAHYVL